MAKKKRIAKEKPAYNPRTAPEMELSFSAQLKIHQEEQRAAEAKRRGGSKWCAERGYHRRRGNMLAGRPGGSGPCLDCGK